MLLFQNDLLAVRPLEEKDKLYLVKWLSDPTVLEFYEGRDNSFNLEKVEKKFYQLDDPEKRCIVEYDEVPIGYIQFYPLDEIERKLYGYGEGCIYGIDQFIGEPSYWNKGIGTLLVTSMVKFLMETKQAEKVVMDPQVCNDRALRCYAKCGFKKVKLMPKRELHEGEYRDCWLLECSAKKILMRR